MVLAMSLACDHKFLLYTSRVFLIAQVVILLPLTRSPCTQPALLTSAETPSVWQPIAFPCWVLEKQSPFISATPPLSAEFFAESPSSGDCFSECFLNNTVMGFHKTHNTSNGITIHRLHGSGNMSSKQSKTSFILISFLSNLHFHFIFHSVTLSIMKIITDLTLVMPSFLIDLYGSSS